MANPSTVNATASGKEVLRRTFSDGAGETASIILTAPTNHIITILSIVIIEQSDLTDAKFDLFVLPDGGSALYLLVNQEVGTRETFVWNDKFVLTGGDVLKTQTYSVAGTATVDIWCSYIDADFT